MKATYVQRGETIDYTNGGEAAIAAGDVVIMGKHIGVAGCDIAVGETGSMHMTGVFKIPKKADEVLAVGDNVTFDDTDGIVKATDPTGGSSATVGSDVHGYAIAAALAEDTEAVIKLMG